jgi:lipopolysaccharide export system permease protein
MKIVDRYLLQHVVEATLRGLLWFGGLLLVFALVSGLRKAIEVSMDFPTMVGLLVRQLPRIVAFTIPMALLFGTVQTFTDLSGRGEMTAFFAGGVSPLRALRTSLWWGLMLALVVFVLQEVVVPLAETQRDEIVRQEVIQQLRSQSFRYVDPPQGGTLNLVMQADTFDPDPPTLRNPVVQLYRPDYSLRLQLRAERAEWNAQKGEWVFYKGSMISFSQHRRLATVHTTFSQLESKQAMQKDLMPVPRMLSGLVFTLRQRIEKRQYEMIPLTQLWHYRESLRGAFSDSKLAGSIDRKILKGATFGIHDKIATPLICLAMVLSGGALGLRPQRAAGGFAMGASLLVLMSYYLIYLWARTLGGAGVGNPVLMAYLPTGLTCIIGGTLLWRKHL